ncbi:pseudouridine synthase [Salinispirillum sp. LH 10-3-1]|uniref:Pseudouridine synthase n=1 Tax=Salinispirillum sp. LH 10-3-1 TaxID=2952525 RepID=A0AB38YBF5_9GAMM
MADIAATRMKSKRGRLDRYIAKTCQHPLRSVKLLLASGQVTVNGVIERDGQRLIHEFDCITCEGRVLQQQTPIYLMLHKPVGVVCATIDRHHKTVLELIDHPRKHELHIVGRLDLNTSGLVLLTNDSRWSRYLTAPESKVPKRYEVMLEKPLTDDYVKAFSDGVYFAYEDLTTAPATLVLTSEYTAEVILTEGKYHQIKRMFGRFRNAVQTLHRSAVGDVELDATLAPGEWRQLAVEELGSPESIAWRSGFLR